jgi:hypothetical protein
MAIWICQFVGREIRLLDYIEGIGQPLACRTVTRSQETHSAR